jgi:hypothetical protein
VAVVSGGLLCLLGVAATAVVNTPLRRFRACDAVHEDTVRTAL